MIFLLYVHTHTVIKILRGLNIPPNFELLLTFHLYFIDILWKENKSIGNICSTYFHSNIPSIMVCSICSVVKKIDQPGFFLSLVIQCFMAFAYDSLGGSC